MTFRFLSLLGGQPQMTDLPTRSVGCLMHKIRVGTLTASFLDYDGYWVCLSSNTFRTIGNPASGASVAANWTQILYTAIWENYDSNQCPVTTSSGVTASRGATAIADYAANKRLFLPDVKGRALVAAGTVKTGDAEKTAGQTLGFDYFQLSIDQMPKHNHRLNALGTPGNSFRNVNVITAGTVDQYVDSFGGLPYVESTGGTSSISVVQSSHVVDVWISAGSR